MAQGEWKSTTKLIEQAKQVLFEQWPMTLRQLFYQLVCIVAIENSTSDYQRLSSIMTKARNDGRIEFRCMVDRSRPEYRPSVFDDAQEYAEVVKEGYHKDYWQLQPQRVELWTEKDAIIGSIEKLARELGITVRVTRGFMSTTKIYEISTFISRSEKPMTVFYLGDHDASGRAIETDLGDRIRSYGAKLTIKRLAIHASDIAKFRAATVARERNRTQEQPVSFAVTATNVWSLMHCRQRSYGGALRKPLRRSWTTSCGTER